MTAAEPILVQDSDVAAAQVYGDAFKRGLFFELAVARYTGAAVSGFTVPRIRGAVAWAGFEAGVRAAAKTIRDLGVVPAADPTIELTVLDVSPFLRIDVRWEDASMVLAAGLFPGAVMRD